MEQISSDQYLERESAKTSFYDYMLSQRELSDRFEQFYQKELLQYRYKIKKNGLKHRLLKRLGKLNQDNKEILVEDVMIKTKRRLWIEAQGFQIQKSIEKKDVTEQRLQKQKSIYSFEEKSRVVESVDDPGFEQVHLLRIESMNDVRQRKRIRWITDIDCWMGGNKHSVGIGGF